MNRTQSFFALLRYQAFASPAIWIFPVAISFQMLIINPGRLHNDLSLVTTVFNFCLWMPMFITSMLFGNDLMNKNRWATHQTHVMANVFNAEFLATRAVSRSNIFFSRSTLYWIMILIPAVIWVVVASFKPSLNLTIMRSPETAQAIADHYLSHIPGSYISKIDPKGGSITILASHGMFYLKAAGACVFILAGLGWQLLTMLIAQWRYGRFIFWSVFALVVGAPILLNIFTVRYKGVEPVLLQVIQHPFLVITAVAAVVTIICTAGLKKFQQQEFA